MESGFCALQLCCFFTFYLINIPSNTEIYMDEFRSLINFEAVEPDAILKKFNDTWSIDAFLNIGKS